MNALLHQLKWQFRLLARHNIITISVIVTLVYVGLFFALQSMGRMDKFLTLLIYNDTAIIGLFFLGIAVIMEKNQQVLSALFVTPLNYHIYLLARILSLSFIGWLCALGMAFAALGTSFHIIHFSAGIWGICILSCITGIYLVSYTSEVLLFMLKSIPLLLFFINLPLLNYFGLTDIRLFYFFPVQGSLNLLSNAYIDAPVRSEIIYGYVAQAIWIPVLYGFVYRIFISKIVTI